MIKVMTINDYEELFELWINMPSMGLRSLDDSKEGISCFLKRNPNTNFVAYEDGRSVGAILCGHDGRRGYICHTVVLPDYRGRGIASGLVISNGWERKDFLGIYSKAITDKENLPLFEI